LRAGHGLAGADQRDRVAEEARDDNHFVIANHFAMLLQVVCEFWYGEVTKQSRCQDVDWLVQKMRREIASQKRLAMTDADERDRFAKEARGDNHSVIANHFAMLPQMVCECWYGEVMKQSRS